MLHRTAGKERGPYLFLSTISSGSRTFRHLFTTLHVRWLPYIFNLHGLQLPKWYSVRFTTLSNYQLIDDRILILLWLLGDVTLGCCNSNLTQKSGGFALASTTSFIFQVYRLTKCDSLPIRDPVYQPYRTHHPHRRRHINIEKIGNVTEEMRKKIFKIRFMINSAVNVRKEMHSGRCNWEFSILKSKTPQSYFSKNVWINTTMYCSKQCNILL